MEQTPADTKSAPSTQPTPAANWNSGWRLMVMFAVIFLVGKLLGVLAALVGAVVFGWLQQKRSAWTALAGGIAAAAVVAVVSSPLVTPYVRPQAIDIPTQSHPKTQPHTADDDWLNKGSTLVK